MTVIIRLEVEGRPEDVFTAVDEVLDAGVLQDAIRDCALDLFGISSPVNVVSALSEPTKD